MHKLQKTVADGSRSSIPPRAGLNWCAGRVGVSVFGLSPPRGELEGRLAEERSCVRTRQRHAHSHRYGLRLGHAARQRTLNFATSSDWESRSKRLSKRRRAACVTLRRPCSLPREVAPHTVPSVAPSIPQKWRPVSPKIDLHQHRVPSTSRGSVSLPPRASAHPESRRADLSASLLCMERLLPPTRGNPDIAHSRFFYADGVQT